MLYIVVGALLIGLALGLMGSGGSILTVPVLTYLLGHDSKAAIAESLVIVGLIALITVFPYARAKLVDWRSVIYFGVPGMAGTYLGAWLAGFVSGPVQLTLFAVVMLLAGYMMFRKPKIVAGESSEVQTETPDNLSEEKSTTHSQEKSKRHATWKIAGEGIVVGILTGLVGVGGGFLIVPALVVLGGLPMRLAVGTSLAVIALKSASGFYKYLDVLEQVGSSIDWWTVAAFVAIGLVGSLLGKLVSSRVNQQTLRRGFALFLLLMGVIILGKEGPGVISHKSAAHSAQNTVQINIDDAAQVQAND